MKKIGVILAGLLFLATANSTYYFLGIAKASLTEWIVFNACAPSSIIYLAGFIVFLFFRNRTPLLVATLPIFFFGGLGLLVFPWSGFNIVAQISHILMMLNLIWAAVETFSVRDFRAASLGLIISILIFAPFIGYQQSYVHGHSDAAKRLLGVESRDLK